MVAEFAASAYPSQRAVAELLRIHDFLELWFNGRVDKNVAAFEPLRRALAVASRARIGAEVHGVGGDCPLITPKNAVRLLGLGA